MDRIGLATLQAEVADDVRVAREATELAIQRLAEASDSGRESCAFQLVRMFNVVEQMGLRITKAFENHIDDERGWHSQLIHRLSLEVPGIRPALYPREMLPALHDLRGFRPIITHAYDLQLEGEKLALVLRQARRLTEALPDMTQRFFETVAD